jgi:3-ketosteroid 9alpha-monooxygenase subunit A
MCGQYWVSKCGVQAKAGQAAQAGRLSGARDKDMRSLAASLARTAHRRGALLMARSAEYNLGEYDFPRGWFVVANSSDVTTTPLNLRYFGEDVVIFRDGAGKAAMLEAYCPHMGTHFGKSKASYVVASGQHVDAHGIRCPFHGWRFGADGKCNDIPYFDGPIPEKARVRSWIIEERYGIVFCWNDPEGKEPDFALPDYPEWDDPAWVRWNGLVSLGDLPCHPIEVFDNNSDQAHLYYAHGGRVRCYENEIDGHVYRQRVSILGERRGGEDTFGAEPRVSTINGYVGPGLNAARFLEVGGAQLIAATPVEDGTAKLWQCAMVKRQPGMSEEEAQAMLAAFNNNMVEGLAIQDGEIWANKRPALQILQLPTDGPFRQARVWYSQFFNPRAKAADILARVEGLHTVRGIPAFEMPKIIA